MSEIFDYEYDPFEGEGKTCNTCHATGLHWEDFGAGFKLYDEDNKKHVCPAAKPTADDFEDLT
jgi:hypothetical protein